MSGEREFPFSDEELKKAAELTAGAMLSRLPEEIDPPHVFSEEFEKKMDGLLALDRARRARRRFLRSAAAVLAVVLVLGSVWLSTDTEAWAGFRRWIRHASGGDEIYEYYGPDDPEPLPKYRVTWLPEGYLFAFEIEEVPGKAWRIAYKFGDTDTLFLTYNYMSDGRTSTVTGDGPLTPEKVTVSGMEGELYYDEGQGSNILAWFDDEAGIAFAIQTNLNREDMMRVAESVKLME